MTIIMTDAQKKELTRKASLLTTDCPDSVLDWRRNALLSYVESLIAEAERRAVKKIKQKLLDIVKFEHGFYTTSELLAIKADRYDSIVEKLSTLGQEGVE